MNAFILAIVIATSSGYKTGATSVVIPFTTKELCMQAGQSLVDQAQSRGNYILTWGCFKQ